MAPTGVKFQGCGADAQCAANRIRRVQAGYDKANFLFEFRLKHFDFSCRMFRNSFGKADSSTAGPKSGGPPLGMTVGFVVAAGCSAVIDRRR